MAKKGCCQCGATTNKDGSKVTWKCSQCGQLVCSGCTLLIPGSSPREYYEDTLCSEKCWEAAGKPEE